MAKKPQPQKEQLDTEDELLNFDLEELSGEDASGEDEVIELLELVEGDKDDDRTKELPLKNRIKEKPAVKPAKAVKPKAVPVVEPVPSAPETRLSEDEEETELDLSDLTLDMDVDTTRPAQTVGEDEITEADLENLLQETSDEEITFDLSSEEGG